MLKSHERFHSSDGRRLLLVADDEMINREILGAILENEYEVIFASDGQEALDKIQANRDRLSLVLLDLMMPVKSGIEVLKEVRNDEILRRIPFIVLTADQDAEVECLNLGAMDYIPKPYPHHSIITARVQKAIELSEDRETIQVTERDPLTGLYNRDFFYLYAEQYDQHHREANMDAVVVDINHFRMINERFGNAYGDKVLRSVAERIKETLADTESIICRKEADTFMIYCPHGVDYKEIRDKASVGLGNSDSVNNRIRLRLGVYENVDKTLDIERRFDRAKMASDTVKGSFAKTIGIYDGKMHERELYAERLIDDFHQAISEGQFKVYYQPKFDIRPKTPVLSSAEALVRWQHPHLGLINPGLFIPLFEENGLIQELDNYVWKETGAQIRRWRENLGFSVPVSVNVSRIDLYDPDLMEKLSSVLRDNGLTADELLLEITESVYTQDSEQIISTVNKLRDLGFRVEMDDFGTGYSSLNLISELPIDALKLDMKFVRNAFSDQRDTRMLEVIIEIADRLGVPVIAEGVEDEEQLLALRDLGCDIAQGFHFSRPVPEEEFTPFILARKDLAPEDLEPEVYEAPEEEVEPEIIEERPLKKAIRLKDINTIFAALALLIAVLLMISDSMVNTYSVRMEEASNGYVQAENAASDLEAGSDYLTESVRLFTVTGNIEYLEDYFEEVNETRRRDKALKTLDELLSDNDKSAYDILSQALDYSNELMEREYEAMRLTQTAYLIADSQVPEEVFRFNLSEADLRLTAAQRKDKAISLVFDEVYTSYKEKIRSNVAKCTDQLIAQSRQEVIRTRESMRHILIVQTILILLLIITVLAEVVFITMQVRAPLSRLVSQMRLQKPATPDGAAELRFVSQTYNDILEENLKSRKQLSYEATHDPLTGLLNRSAYEFFLENVDHDHIALLIIDIDEFKSVNDTYGHDVGDLILKKVADILTQSFRSVDCVCRLGGDEFCVIMTRASSSMRQLVINKITRANDLLQHPKDGLPKVSLSAGVAFSDRENPIGDIFKDADTALYTVKKSKKGGCAVFGEPVV